MTKHMVYVNASIVAGIIATLAVSSTLLMTNSVLASLGESAGQKKDVKCAGEMHTQNYCDGYHIGKGDCENGNKYRGNDTHHTKNWRDGYKAGWNDNGCRTP
jgi:hypothetical protein